MSTEMIFTRLGSAQAVGASGAGSVGHSHTLQVTAAGEGTAALSPAGLAAEEHSATMPLCPVQGGQGEQGEHRVGTQPC